MSRDLIDLKHDFRIKIRKVLDLCQNNGFNIVPFCTLRSIWEQAKLYRQSRSTREILDAIGFLEAQNANFIAKALKDVGPQYGRWATDCLPGESYHNYGLAIDCFALINGRAVWDSDHPAYYEYANRAHDLGLFAGYFWENKDAVHIQDKEERIIDIYSWGEIDKIMEQNFRR